MADERAGRSGGFDSPHASLKGTPKKRVSRGKLDKEENNLPPEETQTRSKNRARRGSLLFPNAMADERMKLKTNTSLRQ